MTDACQARRHVYSVERRMLKNLTFVPGNPGPGAQMPGIRRPWRTVRSGEARVPGGAGGDGLEIAPFHAGHAATARTDDFRLNPVARQDPEQGDTDLRVVVVAVAGGVERRLAAESVRLPIDLQGFRTCPSLQGLAGKFRQGGVPMDAGERVFEILFGFAVFQGYEWHTTLGRCVTGEAFPGGFGILEWAPSAPPGPV